MFLSLLDTCFSLYFTFFSAYKPRKQLGITYFVRTRNKNHILTFQKTFKTKFMRNNLGTCLAICFGVLPFDLYHISTFGSGGIEKSHSCKWAKWIQWHALPHIQQSTQQRNKGYYPNLHGWDFSIPPLPNFFAFLDSLKVEKSPNFRISKTFKQQCFYINVN